VSEKTACEECANPDECNIGCYDWMFKGEKEDGETLEVSESDTE